MESISLAHQGFREGNAADVETVRGWIGAVLRGGNWRFADPESVAQEVLLRLVRLVRADRVRDPGSFQKLVYTVAKNTCVDVYHRERRRDEVVGAELDPEDAPADPAAALPDEGIEQRERDDALRYVLQRLPQSCRELLAWVYGEGADAAEAARRLGVQVVAARVRLHRCLKRARELHASADLRRE